MQHSGISDVEKAFFNIQKLTLPKLYSDEKDYTLLLKRIQSEINRTKELLEFKKKQAKVAESFGRSRS